MPLVVAALLAAGATAAAWSAIRMREREVTKGWEQRKIVVAAGDIPAGTRLASENVAEGSMPEKFVYENLLKPEDLDFAFGREVLVGIKEGEPIHWYQLQGLQGLTKLSQAVQKRGRAITISVDERGSVGQWVRPNDHVDVLGTFRDPTSNQMVAVTLLQNVIVLATGQQQSSIATAQDNNFATVTLLVLPEEAEIVTLGEELGTLRLSLRNADDVSILEDRARTTMDTLLTGERVKKLQERRLQTIQIIRGISGRAQ